MESPSFPGSSKRAKAPGNVPQVAHCLVDGCNADLSRCRDYHRRHKVCEVHSKTPKVTIGGREQRFCQQCSRFHSLVEFDEGKRSCRKRLDGHNRRRRKPQPDSFNRNSGMVFSSQQGVAAGTRLLSFANPPVLPSAVVGSSWPGIVKAENEIVPYNNQQLCYMERPSSSSFPECTAQSRYKGVNQLQFMQGNECAASICQPLLEPNAAASGSSSDRALSLLSSAAPTTREFGLNHTAQTDQPPRPSQATAHSLHYSRLGRYPFLEESKPLISATGSRSSNASTLRFPEMSPEGSSSSGPHQTLTFRWE